MATANELGNQEKRDYYHIANLALFHARLWDALNADTRVKGVVQEIAQRSGLAAIDSLMTQDVFLGMAYVNLVWLYEAFGLKSVAIGQRVEAWFELFKKNESAWRPHPDAKKRELSAEAVAYAVRNAVAHAHIKVTEQEFIMWDHSNGNTQGNRVDFTLTWQQLGTFCEAVFFDLTDALKAQGLWPVPGT